MSMKFVNVIQDLFNMPYYKNYAACSGKVHNLANHESAIEDNLISHGYKRAQGEVGKRIKKVVSEGSDLTKSKDGLNRSNVEEIRDAWISGDLEGCDLQDGEYICQPCGTHNSPDFLVRCDGKVFAIEAKSSKAYSPTYNSGFPKDKYIYVFSNEKLDRTVVYMGSDVNGGQGASLLKEQMLSEIQAVVKKYNSQLKELMSTGLDYYVRDMWNHKGGKEITNYFNEPRRTQWFQSVKEFINE